RIPSRSSKSCHRPSSRSKCRDSERAAPLHLRPAPLSCRTPKPRPRSRRRRHQHAACRTLRASPHEVGRSAPGAPARKRNARAERWVAPRERARLHSPQPETDPELKGSLDDLWLLSVDCGLRAADCSDVEQQVLSLPGADDLQEGLVLVLFDGRVSDDEPLAEHLDERTAIAQQPQGILYVSRQRK